jgi:hypothetical protein
MAIAERPGAVAMRSVSAPEVIERGGRERRGNGRI